MAVLGSASFLWVDGVRISTLATIGAFAVLGIVRRGDATPLLAAAAWLAGFEVAYQVTAVAMGTALYPRAALIFVLIGLVLLTFATRRGVRPSLPLMGIVAVAWIVWIAFGFHANQHETPEVFSSLDEVLNEGAKTLWAIAYMLPLWQTRPVERRI